MCTSNPENSSENPSLYRYISFEKAVSLFTNGFYVPIAKSFEDLNECKIKHLPRYLEEDIRNRVEDCLKKIKELPCDTSHPIGSANLAEQYKDCFGEFFESVDSKEISCRSLESILGIISFAVSDYGKTHIITDFPSKSIKCCAIAFCIPQNDEKSKGKLYRLFESLAKEDLKGALISCWTKNPKESYILWRSYAEKKGVRIKTTKDKLEKLLNKKRAGTGDWPEEKGDFFFFGEFEVKMGEVIYHSKEELKKKLDSSSFKKIESKSGLLVEIAFLKSDVYEDEKEFRVLLLSSKWDAAKLTGILDPRAGVVFPLPEVPSDFLEEIMLSPFLSEFDKKSYTQLFDKLFPGVSVCPSNIDLG